MKDFTTQIICTSLLLLATIGSKGQVDTSSVWQDTATIQNLGTPIGSEPFEYQPVFKSDDSKIYWGSRAPAPNLTLEIQQPDSSVFSLENLPEIWLRNDTKDTFWVAFENRTFCCIELHLRFENGGGFLIPYNYQFFDYPTREDVQIQLIPGDHFRFIPKTNPEFEWSDTHKGYWYEHKWFPTKREEDIWSEPIPLDSTMQNTLTPVYKETTSHKVEFKAEGRGGAHLIAFAWSTPSQNYPETCWEGSIESRKVAVKYRFE